MQSLGGNWFLHPRVHINRGVRYHTTTTSGLQEVARLARASPLVVDITVPAQQASRVAQRQAERYPSITQDHGTRSALRRVDMPAVQLVILPPEKGDITLLLLSNLVPENSREQWRLALDPDEPLRWKNYELCRLPDGRITWRLSEQVRAHYRMHITRSITGRGGHPQPGERPYQLPPETARQQVLSLAQHLTRYPGLSGIRKDVFALAHHSTKIWRNTHPQEPFPMWPKMPYARYGSPKTAPLDHLLEENHDQK